MVLRRLVWSGVFPWTARTADEIDRVERLTHATYTPTGWIGQRIGQAVKTAVGNVPIRIAEQREEDVLVQLTRLEQLKIN